MDPLTPELKDDIEKKFGKPNQWKRALSLIKLRKLGNKIGLQKGYVRGMSRETLLPFILDQWNAGQSSSTGLCIIKC